MLLAIDSGNTNIVFAVFDDAGESRGEWRSSTNTDRTADEFGVWLTQLMSLEDIDRKTVDAAIIATVVPATLHSLRMLCRRYFDCEPLVVGAPGVDLGIEIQVDQPEEVGADRLVNAISAFERYGGPLIIIDFGTATTFDTIDKDGNYLGGAIAPGINLSLEALHRAAAKLPRVAIGRPASVIGKNTVAAMRSGIFWGYVGMIEGLVARIREERGDPTIRVVATGGLSAFFTDSIPLISESDPDLTLRGLLHIHRRNHAAAVAAAAAAATTP
ncbi:MAG: type III pantothenate kinase [Rhodobacterales bacterium]|nr:type III pantothenate kinase [Rhodobacterales bacterium]